MIALFILKFFFLFPFDLGAGSLSLAAADKTPSCELLDLSIDLLPVSAIIEIDLNNTPQIERIRLEKYRNNQFVQVREWSNNSQIYLYRDDRLVGGINLYRVLLQMEDGSEQICATEQVFFLVPNRLFIYPNPIARGATLNIGLADFENRVIEVYDLNGKMIYKNQLNNNFTEIPHINWPIGTYFYQIVEAEKLITHKGQFLVQ